MKQMSVGEYAMLPPQSCSKFAEGALILILSAYMGYATRYSFKKKKKGSVWIHQFVMTLGGSSNKKFLEPCPPKL